MKPQKSDRVHAEGTPLWWGEQDPSQETDTLAYLTMSLAPEGETASLNLDAAEDRTFSALALRDRVVIMLLFDQVVREEQVHQAWSLWRKMESQNTREPLWRVMTLFPELDRDLVYAEAARVYGFEEARITRPTALRLIQQIERRLERGVWEQMVELRVVPIAEVEQHHTHRPRIAFAAQDPTRPEIHRLLPRLNLGGYELRYAPEAEILSLLIEAFPHRFQHLKGLSGLTQDLLAGATPTPDGPLDEAAFAAALETEEASDTAVRDQASLLSWFEDVLVEAVREQATDVCLLPTPDGYIEVYFQIQDELHRQRVVDHIPPNLLLVAVKSSLLRGKDCADGKIQNRLIQRWIDDGVVRFRISAVPASEEVHAECVVVRVLS